MAESEDITRFLKKFQSSSTDVKEQFNDLLERKEYQKRINVMIDEYVVTEEFINRVRRYARQEFDSMILRVMIWVVGIALGTIITLLLTDLSGKVRL